VSPSPLGGVMVTTTFASARAGTSASGRRTGQGVLPYGGFTVNGSRGIDEPYHADGEQT
jgi:hypothetical protein